jgi:hypothetical protein
MTDLEDYLMNWLPYPYFTKSWIGGDGSREISVRRAGLAQDGPHTIEVYNTTVSQHDFFHYSELWDRVLAESKFCITFAP